MSGPKVSIYRVDPKITRNILEQTLCQHQMIRCAASIRGFISETDGCGYDVEKLIQGLERMQRRTGKGGDTLKALKRCYDEMQQEDSRILSELRQYGSFDDGMPVYDETALEQKKEIMRKLKKMERNVEKNLGRLHKAISAAKDEDRSGREDVKKSIEGDMSGFYSFDLLAQAEKRSAESKSLEWKGRLQTVLFDDILSNDIKNNARQALQMLEQIDSEDQVQNFIVLTGTPLMIRAEEERTEYRRKCDELRQTNETLCVLMGLEAREVPRDEREFALLEEENRNLCAAMLYQQEQTYISDRVNQVMREMGYDLIGKRDVQKRSGRRFHNDLYTFGDGKAVSVTQSSDGQITMELGGIDMQDRLPDAAEAVQLRDEMETFCHDFAEIERRLAGYGITLGTRVEMLPPNEAYAEIINFCDYEKVGDAPVHTFAEVQRGEAEQWQLTRGIEE